MEACRRRREGKLFLKRLRIISNVLTQWYLRSRWESSSEAICIRHILPDRRWSAVIRYWDCQSKMNLVGGPDHHQEARPVLKNGSRHNPRHEPFGNKT